MTDLLCLIFVLLKCELNSSLLVELARKMLLPDKHTTDNSTKVILIL